MSDIQKLREHLFNTLTALQDKENPMDIDRAKAVCEVGSVIVDTAKAEIDFLRVNGSIETQFFSKPSLPVTNSRLPMDDFDSPKKIELPKNTEPTHAEKMGYVTVDGNVTTHKLR